MPARPPPRTNMMPRLTRVPSAGRTREQRDSGGARSSGYGSASTSMSVSSASTEARSSTSRASTSHFADQSAQRSTSLCEKPVPLYRPNPRSPRLQPAASHAYSACACPQSTSAPISTRVCAMPNRRSWSAVFAASRTPRRSLVSRTMSAMPGRSEDHPPRDATRVSVARSPDGLSRSKGGGAASLPASGSGSGVVPLPV
mmetsp:Transcript_30884/g.98796  ORF Transcript_30884/g.98796 Transcript_30884/m.98796 type:complete len:200 (+) Transcript_30884:1015-1614(+)